jgi:hypothetical protein
MKEYRLSAWPELDSPFDRMAFRRMLAEMSQRHVSLPRLVSSSGLARREVRRFVRMLESRGVLSERVSSSSDSVFGSLAPLRSWLAKAR